MARPKTRIVSWTGVNVGLLHEAKLQLARVIPSDIRKSLSFRLLAKDSANRWKPQDGGIALRLSNRWRIPLTS